ncbi:hypothetical protein Q7C36_021577 [Tachysurus vachellii]|uniref:Uncharacterized protein n=1 Tax=Tachysurus vachellii TaxID=175792 RepID=A0AA88LQ81_TACVA|nr:hypothetical protein Q7C36_021577 [Tachysurus vachellii]
MFLLGLKMAQWLITAVQPIWQHLCQLYSTMGWMDYIHEKGCTMVAFRDLMKLVWVSFAFILWYIIDMFLLGLKMAQWLITAVQPIWQHLCQLYSTMQDDVDSTLTKRTKGWMDYIVKKVGPPKEHKFHILVTGNDLNCHKHILKSLGIKDEGISMDQCDVIIAFVPIVSRAGTDIQAALQMIPESRPAVLVALHHTFDSDYIAPDSRRNIDRSNIFSVDMLFYENVGLLNSFKNTKALEETTKHLQIIK